MTVKMVWSTIVLLPVTIASSLLVGCVQESPAISQEVVRINEMQWLVVGVLVALIVLWMIIKSAVRQGSYEAKSTSNQPSDSDAHDQVLNYILSARAHGQSDDAIKASLVQKGWSDDDLRTIWERVPPIPLPPAP